MYKWNLRNLIKNDVKEISQNKYGRNSNCYRLLSSCKYIVQYGISTRSKWRYGPQRASPGTLLAYNISRRLGAVHENRIFWCRQYVNKWLPTVRNTNRCFKLFVSARLNDFHSKLHVFYEPPNSNLLTRVSLSLASKHVRKP